MKILVADDDLITRRVLGKLLPTWGYNIVLAEDGISALKAVLNDPEITLALLDWAMPGLTGVEICKEMKHLPYGRFIYSIILTGNTDKASLIQAIEDGADDFISKPFDIEILKTRLRAGVRIVESQSDLRHLNLSLDSQVKERTEALEEAVKAAQHASSMKSIFLANMSHEIRTPLNGIVSYVELLLLSELNDEQREDLHTIKSCVNSLRTIINDVLDFSKIEAGKMLIDNSQFRLKNAIEEVIEFLDAKRAEQGLEIVLNIGDEVPDEVIGDKVRVQQILTNLLANAYKFSSPSGAAVIHLNKTGENRETGVQFIRLSVADCGIGIPKAKQEIIFDAFSQADTSTSRQYGGTGLGLAISKKLADLLEGRLWLDSLEGFGTTFHFEFPVRIPTSKLLSLENIESEHQLLASLNQKNKHILLAEDNMINRNAVERILVKAGYEVTCVSNGQEVLDAIATQTFSIVLLDIQMPVMDGFEAMKSMQKQKCKIPVVALTANAMEHDCTKYFALGMKDVVSKPIDYKNLFAVIDKVTSQGEAHE